MSVIGFNLNRMEAKRKPAEHKESGEIKVNSTPKIIAVREANLHNVDKKALSLDFEFVTTYEPELAEIMVGGKLIYLAKDYKAVLDQWKKDKSLPEDVSVPILNHLFRHCLLRISNMAEDLNLPLPLQIPRVKEKETPQ